VRDEEHISSMERILKEKHFDGTKLVLNRLSIFMSKTHGWPIGNHQLHNSGMNMKLLKPAKR
jgi:hypothetical protein